MNLSINNFYVSLSFVLSLGYLGSNRHNVNQIDIVLIAFDIDIVPMYI